MVLIALPSEQCRQDASRKYCLELDRRSLKMGNIRRRFCLFWRYEQNGVAVEERRHVLLFGEHLPEEGTLKLDTNQGGLSSWLS